MKLFNNIALIAFMSAGGIGDTYAAQVLIKNADVPDLSNYDLVFDYQGPHYQGSPGSAHGKVTVLIPHIEQTPSAGSGTTLNIPNGDLYDVYLRRHGARPGSSGYVVCSKELDAAQDKAVQEHKARPFLEITQSSFPLVIHISNVPHLDCDLSTEREYKRVEH